MKQKVIKFVLRKEDDGNILAVYNKEASKDLELTAISYNDSNIGLSLGYYKEKTEPVKNLEDEMNMLQYLRKLFLPEIKPVSVKRLNLKDLVK